MMTQQRSSTSILFFFWRLAHLTGDLSQAEQMHKMATKDLFIMNPKNCIWHYENVSKFEFKAQI